MEGSMSGVKNKLSLIDSKESWMQLTKSKTITAVRWKELITVIIIRPWIVIIKIDNNYTNANNNNNNNVNKCIDNNDL